MADLKEEVKEAELKFYVKDTVELILPSFKQFKPLGVKSDLFNEFINSKEQYQGEIKYIGPIKNSKIVYYGVQLFNKQSKYIHSNGTIQNTIYIDTGNKLDNNIINLCIFCDKQSLKLISTYLVFLYITLFYLYNNKSHINRTS